jgi:hypothetical protein
MIKTLQEAASIYKQDKGTIDWLVHQDVKDAKRFSIVERYESKGDIKTRESIGTVEGGFLLNNSLTDVRNPYFKTFRTTVGVSLRLGYFDKSMCVESCCIFTALVSQADSNSRVQQIIGLGR